MFVIKRKTPPAQSTQHVHRQDSGGPPDHFPNLTSFFQVRELYHSRVFVPPFVCLYPTLYDGESCCVLRGVLEPQARGGLRVQIPACVICDSQVKAYLLGLLAKIKCSICSYQLNLWYSRQCLVEINLISRRGLQKVLAPDVDMCDFGPALLPWSLTSAFFE